MLVHDVNCTLNEKSFGSASCSMDVLEILRDDEFFFDYKTKLNNPLAVIIIIVSLCFCKALLAGGRLGKAVDNDDD